MALCQLQKCGVAHMEKGKVQELGTSELVGTGAIKEVTVRNMYRYLGVDQVFRPNRSGVRKKLKTRFLKRLKVIWSSSLRAVHKVNAAYTWAMAAFRYYLTVVR